MIGWALLRITDSFVYRSTKMCEIKMKTFDPVDFKEDPETKLQIALNICGH